MGVAFARPAQLLLAYSNSDLAGTAAGALGLASQEGSSWFAILGGSVDPVTRTLRVPVTSTAPGPASAGQGRIPQRAAQSGTVGPYGSATVFPTERSVVEDGSVQLALNYVGPSSSASSTPGYVGLTYTAPAGLTAVWQINSTFGSGEGTISPTPLGTLAEYRAPSCVPLFNPVTVQVSARVGNGPVSLSTARIQIIQKRWYFAVTYRVEHTCQYLYSYYFEQSHTFNEFLIHDDQVFNFARGQGHTNTEFPAAWCPGVIDGENCTQPQLSLSGDLEVLFVSGTFDGRGLDPLFDLNVTADFPGTDAAYTFQCGNPPQQIREPVPHALPRQATRETPIRYSSKTWSLSIPHTGETVTVTLTPRTCP